MTKTDLTSYIEKIIEDEKKLLEERKKQNETMEMLGEFLEEWKKQQKQQQ